MWGGSYYGEALRFLKNRVADEDVFIEEVEQVTRNLRNGDSYFCVNHGVDRRLLRGDEDVAAVGIVANGNGYVFARKDADPVEDRDVEQFCFMQFSRQENAHRPYLRTTAYAEGLKFESDLLPEPRYGHGRADLYYQLLKEVSPHPDEDIRLFRPGYTPSRPRETVGQS